MQFLLHPLKFFTELCGLIGVLFTKLVEFSSQKDSATDQRSKDKEQGRSHLRRGRNGCKQPENDEDKDLHATPQFAQYPGTSSTILERYSCFFLHRCRWEILSN